MRHINQKKENRIRIYHGWIVVATCFLVMASIAPLLTSFSIFQGPILNEFRWSRESFAITLAIHLVFGGLAAPVAGGLIDRFGPRRVMPIGAALTALGLILMSQGDSLWHFYVAYGLMAAAGSSLIHLVPLTTVIANWFTRHRGKAIGIVDTGSGAGQSILEPAIKLLIDHIGWRLTILVYGLMILVIPTTLILLFLHKRPEDKGLSIEEESGATAETTGEEPGRNNRAAGRSEVIILDKEWAEVDWTVRKASRTVRFWAMALLMVLYATGMMLVSAPLVLYLEGKGYRSIIVASVLGLQGLLNMAGQFFGGLMCDRIGREKTLTLSIVLFGAGIVFLNLAGTVFSLTLVYLFTFFYGIGQGMALPSLMISVSDLFQGKHFGSILGVIFIGGYFGGAIGAWLSGRLFDLTGAYQVHFIVCGLAMLISVALIWKARPGGIRQMRILKTH
jgi:MFS family permease